MSAMTDDELLERLGECLLADPAPPGADERVALHRALDETPAASVVALHTERQWRRFRRPVAATIAATILLSGSAAAAVETNTLPGPLRNLALTLGLPVTPAAFAQARSALSDLTSALAAQDPVAVRADLARLEAALAQLSPSARAELGPGVTGLIAQAEIFLGSQPGATSDEKSSAGSRDGDRGGDRENSSDDATGVDGSSGRADGGGPLGENDSDGSPAQAGPSAPTGSVSSGQSDGDDTSSGAAASGTPSLTGVDGDGSSGSSDGGSTTVGTTNPSGGSDGSGTSDGSDGSGGSGTSHGSDGGSGGTDGGGSVS